MSHIKSVEIRQARNNDIAQVSAILCEVAMWLDSINQPLWQCNELTEEKIAEEVRSGLYFIALMHDEAVGVV